MKGDLFFSDGSTLFRAPADITGNKTVESDFFRTINSLYYKTNELFFVAKNIEPGVYMKPVVHNE